jgi:hypothetical protein
MTRAEMQQLMDDLAWCFGKAAVDRLLAEEAEEHRAAPPQAPARPPEAPR